MKCDFSRILSSAVLVKRPSQSLKMFMGAEVRYWMCVMASIPWLPCSTENWGVVYFDIRTEFLQMAHVGTALGMAGIL